MLELGHNISIFLFYRRTGHFLKMLSRYQGHNTTYMSGFIVNYIILFLSKEILLIFQILFVIDHVTAAFCESW